MALFGSGRQFAALGGGRSQPPFGMPGPISGYGGGTFDLDGTQATPAYSMPQDAALQDGANLGRAGVPQQQPGFWQGGGKFTLRDGIAGALAAVGDGLSRHYGGDGGAVGLLMQSRMMPAVQAAQLAAEQRRQAMDLATYEAKKGIDARYATPDAPKPGSFEWWNDPARTPQEKAAYSQYMDTTNPAIVNTWQGNVHVPRSSLAGGLNRPEVGARVSISDIVGGAPDQQRQPPAVPIRGAQSISGQEYQRILRSMNGDQRRMNAWMAENNIIVGN